MYTVKDKRIVLFGGTGFLGRELATRLYRRGAYVTIAARHPERCRELMVLPRVRAIQGDVRDAAFVGRALAGQDAAVNLVGLLTAPPKILRAVHVDWPARLAESGRGLQRLVHVSACNADAQGPSRYLATKGEGEERIRRSEAPWSIVAPSLVFGPGDSFFRKFATLLKLAPLAMPVVRPRTRFTPVYVGDVAEAIVRTLARPDLAGKRLALGGPEEWTMRDVLVYLRRIMGLKKFLIDLPDPLAKLQGAVMGMLPGEPFSLEQFRTLSVDACADTDALRDLKIEPEAVEGVVPLYLGDQRRQAQYDRYRHRSSGAPTPTP